MSGVGMDVVLYSAEWVARDEHQPVVSVITQLLQPPAQESETNAGAR
jgi:hypothetical protein